MTTGGYLAKIVTGRVAPWSVWHLYVIATTRQAMGGETGRGPCVSLKTEQVKWGAKKIVMPTAACWGALPFSHLPEDSVGIKKKRRTEHTLGHQSLRQQVTCATGSFLLLLPISPVLICMADNSYIVVVAPVDISVCILHSRAGFSLLPSDDISQKSTARN